MTETKPSTTKEGAPELYPVLPLRDIVVFPYMIVPLVRRPREVDRRPRRGDAIRQADPAGRAEERQRRRALHRWHLPDGHARLRAAAAQASRRHREGAGRGHAPRVHQALHRERELFRGRDRARRGDRRRRGRDRGARPLRRLAVRELREAEQEDLARGARHREPDRGLFQARRHHRLASRHQDRREAADPRDHLGLRAARARLHADGERDLRAAGRAEDQEPRQASDGEDAARVLPERADEGDPEGARRQRGGPRRPRRDRAEDREDQALPRGPREGARRAEEAPPDEPDVGRSDRRAQLSRLAADDPVGRQGQDQARPRRGAEDPRRGSLRTGEGQGPHRRIPRGAEPHQQAEGPDPVPGRPSRRRQDLARQVDGARHGPRVRAHEPWAACATRPRSEATAAPISARCPAR